MLSENCAKQLEITVKSANRDILNELAIMDAVFTESDSLESMSRSMNIVMFWKLLQFAYVKRINEKYLQVKKKTRISSN